MKLIIFSVLLAFSLGFPHKTKYADNIFDVAENLGASSLTKLVAEANIVPQLRGPGPFTLFAPTNEAFLSLPDGVLQEFQKDLHLLAKVLEYHVIPGSFHTSCAVDEELLRSKQGNYVRINTYNANRTFVSGSLILTADKDASNGVVHLIDKVLYPIPNGTVLGVVEKNTMFSTFFKYLHESGHAHSLSEMVPVTLFCPTDDAFSKLSKDILDRLSQDKKFLMSVLEYHTVRKTYYVESLVNAENLTTISGHKLEIKKSGSTGLFVGTARVIRVDLVATNGVVYGLDEVMIPPTGFFSKTLGHDTTRYRSKEDMAPKLREMVVEKRHNVL